MHKLLIAALISGTGFAGIALAAATPAAAASTGTFCDGNYADIDANKSEITQRLSEEGIKATSIEEWNGCVRAFVENANGTQTMVLLDPDTLQPINRVAHV
jgi:hypothetical protein